MRPDLEGSEGILAHDLMPGGVEAVTLQVLSETVVGRVGRNVRFAIGHVVCSAMVLGVSVLPREVRDQKGLVQDESNDVVEGLGR